MSIRFDRLTLLGTFVRIADRGSLSAAARDLGTSQPSVSRQLAALEERLGVVLARRTTHEVTLTPDGLALLEDARRMLGEWEVIEDRHTNNGALKGVIRVVAPVALGQNLLVRAATQFMIDHPAVSLEWSLRDDIIRFAEEGCDCWIKVGAVPDDTLVIRKLAQVERLVVGAPECLAVHDGTELREMPWLTLGPFEGNRIELFDHDGASHTFSVVPKMASDNIFAIFEAVKRGIGIAVLPRWFVLTELETGRLTNVAPDFRAASLPVNLAISTGPKRPARVEKFCDAIQSWCVAHLDQ